MTELAEAMRLLQAQARPGELAGMARLRIAGAGRLGLSVPAMRTIARQLGRDHPLALALWGTGIADARIVAGYIADPARMNGRTMDAWARGFDAWDVCDQVCGSAFLTAPAAWAKVQAWSMREPEFVRRAAFALLATLAVHDRTSPDARFAAALHWIEAAADDERNFVRKAVNWALRNIGKRNLALNAQAIAAARRLRARGTKSARWISADALRELTGLPVQARLQRAATA